MDEVTLDQVLDGMRARLRAQAEGRPHTGADCLAFGRARLLVLDPIRRTPQEDTHLTTCRRCRMLLAGFERALPHLPLWTLIRSRLGTLTSSERRMLEYHLERGGCQVCRERREQLTGGPLSVLVLPSPTVPVLPNAAQAAVPGPEVLAAATGDGLEAELVQYRDELSLELRTREAALSGKLATYSFQNAGGESLLEGYVVLGPDVVGWYTAEVRIEKALYHERVGPRLDRLWIGIIEAEYLSPEEWTRLQKSAPGPTAEPEVRSLWLDWCTRNLLTDRGLPEGARAVLQSLIERLR